jgi:hypothetical protein
MFLCYIFGVIKLGYPELCFAASDVIFTSKTDFSVLVAVKEECNTLY